MVATSEPGQHLVAHGAGGRAEVVDADLVAQERREVAAPHRPVGELSHVGDHEVHGHPTHQRTAAAADDYLRTGLLVGRTRRPRDAVAVAGRQDGEAAIAGEAALAPVADTFAGFRLAHLNDANADAYDRPHGILAVYEYRPAVERDPRPHEV